MERQMLAFLGEGDEGALLGAIEELDPGLVILPGKYVSTSDVEALLSRPGDFTFRQALRSQRRLYLAHGKNARDLRLLRQPDGSFGIDELCSEVLVLESSGPANGRLAPSRLAATVVDHLGHEKIAKSPSFSRWVARVLRGLAGRWPASSVEYIAVLPGARAFAEAGGMLTFLEEPVGLAAQAPRQASKERIR